MGGYDTSYFDDTRVWERVLSLTGALLQHMAANPQTQPLVQQMLSAGLQPSPPVPAAEIGRFTEPMTGLHVREIQNTEVMGHYFGL